MYFLLYTDGQEDGNFQKNLLHPDELPDKTTNKTARKHYDNGTPSVGRPATTNIERNREAKRRSNNEKKEKRKKKRHGADETT